MEETIAAIATAPGESGIGIIRMSGENSIDILEKIFISFNNKSIKDYENKKLVYGYIMDNYNNEKIDEVLAVYMKKPNTYTREDVVEINCHGGLIPTKKILELVLRNGAKIAERGEFTKRAFLNGRIDLAQAEAVIDLIRAKTDKSFDIALDQLEGTLSYEVKKIKEEILEVIAHITVNIDFPDEDIEELTYNELQNKLKNISQKIKDLLDTADTGKIIKEGLKVGIIGKPNVGKSSLMNTLLKESRAIVTDVPGTTRDVIEETVSIKGIPLVIADTAGIRETEDIVEKIGVEKSKEFFNKSDLVILVLNNSEDLTQDDIKIIELLNDRQAIVIVNKIDLPSKLNIEKVKNLLPNKKIIETSIVKRIGIKELEDAIIELVYKGLVSPKESCLVSNVRHKNALERSYSSIQDAIDMTEQREALDFIEVDVKNSWEALGEITGDTVSEDIIDEIFSNFCLGK